MRRFVNWSGVHRAAPARWHQPASEDELAALLVDTARAGGAIRAVGAAHSWSDIAVPHEAALDLSRLRGVLAIDEDPIAPTITVAGGTRLEEITAALDARGLAMPILGSIAQQTIAGAIATATHGSSLTHGNLASLVSALRLVTGRGELLDLDGNDPRLAGARVHLGALGVVTRVTLRVTRAFALHETREPLPLATVVRDFEAIARSAEYVKLWWLPSTGRVLVFRYDRTDLAPQHSRLAAFVDERIVNRGVFELALRVVGRLPRATGALNRTIAATYLRAGDRVARSDRAFNLAMPPRHREAEWAFPIARAAGAVDELDALIRRDRLRINFPCELRFVRADDAWMSPAYGGDVCQIGVYQAQSPDLAAYFAGAAAIAARQDARPHWGKEVDLDATAVAARFPRAREFAALAAELDPDAIFENRFLARVLGARR
jgi:FAD/FMN-containing dehydrogenase